MSQHSSRSYGRTTPTPPVLLIPLYPILSPPFKLHIHLPSLQNSIRRHDVDLTTIFIRPAVRWSVAPALGWWFGLYGAGSKLVGTLVARGGELFVGFHDGRDFRMDGVEYLFEKSAEGGEASGDYYYVYFKTVQGVT